MAQQLKNYNVIVTGGTGGLGKVVVSEFLKAGANVFTNNRTPDKFDELKQLSPKPDSLTGAGADLLIEKEVISFFDKALKDLKRLDVFVHIMGGFWMGDEVADTSLKNWNRMMDLNLNSTFLCTREAFRIMRKQCSGKIFTVSAKTAEESPPQMGAYSVSKAGVMALTQTLAHEGKEYDILVNSLLPSIIDTPGNRKAMPDADYSKWVKPEDIAGLLIQLSRAETQILSNSNLRVFGKI